MFNQPQSSPFQTFPSSPFGQPQPGPTMSQFGTPFGQSQPSAQPVQPQQSIFNQNQIVPWAQNGFNQPTSMMDLDIPQQQRITFENQCQPGFGTQFQVPQQQQQQQPGQFWNQCNQQAYQNNNIPNVFGQQQTFRQPQPVFGQPCINQNMPQSQQAPQSFVIMQQPQNGQQQQPVILYQVQEKPLLFPLGDNGASTWGNTSYYPERPISILQGRGHSIFSPDPRFHSPLFEWAQKPNSSGELYVTGYNPDLMNTFMKYPGEQVIENARDKRLEKMEIESLKAQVEMLKARDRYKTMIEKNAFEPVPSPVPSPVGLFEHRFMRDEFDDFWEARKNSKSSGPPKYNDGIDPITGKTFLEKFMNSGGTPKTRMRSLARPSGYVDTIFDRPSSQCRETLSHSAFPNTPNSSQQPFVNKRLPSGLILPGLGSRVFKELPPIFRAPTRIGGGTKSLILTSVSVCGVKMTEPKYYCIPSLSTLDFMYNSETGKTLVTDFVVGHERHGRITFPGEANVSGLNLDDIVKFTHKTVEVYPDGNCKPAYGQELNRKGIVVLNNVFPVCKQTGWDIRDVEKIKNLHYEHVLLRACLRFNGKFLNYNPHTGCWTFEIQTNPDN